MQRPDFERWLAETLEDLRMSRGERQALRGVLGDAQLTEQQRAKLRHRAFEMAKEVVSSRDGQQVVDWLYEVVKAMAPEAAGASRLADVVFSPGDDCLNALLQYLGGARQTVDICVFTITDNRVARSIVDAHERGVAIRIVTDDDKAGDLGSDVERLAERNITVRYDRSPHHMHHKFAVFDRQVVLTGSYNWTRSAAEHNRENILLSDDPRLVRPYHKAFQQLWDELE